MARVVLEQLNKSFPGSRKTAAHAAVRDLSLEVRDGEFLVLVGPSGCGKSTTLRLIAGLEEPTSGIIRIGDQVVNAVEPKDRDIAMVFQNYALYPHMTVRENMSFGLRLRRVDQHEIRDRIQHTAALLGLSELLERLPKELSGGQRQRVAVGRAIVRKPKVFLFDEPLSNLDAQMRTQMRSELSRLHQQLKATMIYVTHDQSEAMTLGDRIAVLDQGRLQQVDDPVHLYQRPANPFVAGFIGSPPMNLFSARVRSQGTHRWEVEMGSSKAGTPGPVVSIPSLAGEPAPAVPAEVRLGVRPEHLSESPDSEAMTITGTVELVELLGAETLLHLSWAGQPFIARVPSQVRYDRGHPMKFYARAEHLRIFDAASGRALA